MLQELAGCIHDANVACWDVEGGPGGGGGGGHVGRGPPGVMLMNVCALLPAMLCWSQFTLKTGS